MNRFLLSLLSEIIEDESITIVQLSEKFNRDTSHIIKSINNLNGQLPKDKYIIIRKNKLIKNFTYDEYIDFITGLNMDFYKVNIKERMDYLVIKLVLNKIVAKTTIYNEINLSQSTLKKDKDVIRNKVNNIQSFLKVHQKKGVELIGNELNIRLNLVNTLINKLQIKNFELTKNVKNSPLDNKLCDVFLEKTKGISIKIESIIDVHKFYYSSMKYIVIYYYIAKIRNDMGMYIDQIITPSCPLLDDLINSRTNTKENNINFESIYTSYIYESMSPKAERKSVINQELIHLIHQLIDFLIACNVTIIHSNELTDDLYHLLKREYLRNLLKIELADNKIKTVYHLNVDLHDNISIFFTKRNQCKFSRVINETSISKIIITILYYAELYKNVGIEKKKIIIISNSTKQTLSLLMGKLTSFYYLEVVDIIDSNEMYKLNNLSYDHLLCFTKKLKNRIESIGLICHMIDFNLTDEALLKLKSLLGLNYK